MLTAYFVVFPLGIDITRMHGVPYHFKFSRPRPSCLYCQLPDTTNQDQNTGSREKVHQIDGFDVRASKKENSNERYLAYSELSIYQFNLWLAVFAAIDCSLWNEGINSGRGRHNSSCTPKNCVPSLWIREERGGGPSSLSFSSPLSLSSCLHENSG